MLLLLLLLLLLLRVSVGKFPDRWVNFACH
jgi:hypothetical protein